jgi:hypothetical protein
MRPKAAHQHGDRELAGNSPSTRRSRFFLNTVASQIGASTPSPTNQRNSKL